MSQMINHGYYGGDACRLAQMSGDGVSWEMPPTFLGELATVTGLRMAPLTSFDAVARALNLPPIQALHVTGNEDLPPVTSGLGPMKALTPEQLTWYMRDLASFLGIISSNRSILDVCMGMPQSAGMAYVVCPVPWQEIEAKDGEYVQQLAMLAELPAEERAGALAACIPYVTGVVAACLGQAREVLDRPLHTQGRRKAYQNGAVRAARGGQKRGSAGAQDPAPVPVQQHLPPHNRPRELVGRGVSCMSI